MHHCVARWMPCEWTLRIQGWVPVFSFCYYTHSRPLLPYFHGNQTIFSEHVEWIFLPASKFIWYLLLWGYLSYLMVFHSIIVHYHHCGETNHDEFLVNHSSSIEWTICVFRSERVPVFIYWIDIGTAACLGQRCWSATSFSISVWDRLSFPPCAANAKFQLNFTIT